MNVVVWFFLCMSTAVAALAEPSLMLQAECAFDQKCNIYGRACKDADKVYSLKVSEYPTNLRASGSKGVIDFGFDTYLATAELSSEGRTFNGAFSSEERLLWFSELSERRLRFTARGPDFEAWILNIAPDRSAQMKISEGRDFLVSWSLLGNCTVSVPKQWIVE